MFASEAPGSGYFSTIAISLPNCIRENTRLFARSGAEECKLMHNLCAQIGHLYLIRFPAFDVIR
jgi:hypothetical protein